MKCVRLSAFSRAFSHAKNIVDHVFHYLRRTSVKDLRCRCRASPWQHPVNTNTTSANQPWYLSLRWKGRLRTNRTTCISRALLQRRTENSCRHPVLIPKTLPDGDAENTGKRYMFSRQPVPYIVPATAVVVVVLWCSAVSLPRFILAYKHKHTSLRQIVCMLHDPLLAGDAGILSRSELAALVDLTLRHRPMVEGLHLAHLSKHLHAQYHSVGQGRKHRPKTRCQNCSRYNYRRT